MEFSDVMNADNDSTESGDTARDREEEINDLIEEDAAGKSQKEIYEEVVIEINVAKKRGKTKIRCAKINSLAFIHIITDAWEKLRKKDYINTQFAAKDRESRKVDISDLVYERVSGTENGNDTETTN